MLVFLFVFDGYKLYMNVNVDKPHKWQCNNDDCMKQLQRHTKSIRKEYVYRIYTIVIDFMFLIVQYVNVVLVEPLLILVLLTEMAQ